MNDFGRGHLKIKRVNLNFILESSDKVNLTFYVLTFNFY